MKLLLTLVFVFLVHFVVFVRGDCAVRYQQCAKPVNGTGPLKMFTHIGCGLQTGPKGHPDYEWVKAPLSECGGPSDVE